MKTTRRTLLGMVAGLFGGFGLTWAKPVPARRTYEIWTLAETGERVLIERIHIPGAEEPDELVERGYWRSWPGAGAFLARDAVIRSDWELRHKVR